MKTSLYRLAWNRPSSWTQTEAFLWTAAGAGLFGSYLWVRGGPKGPTPALLAGAFSVCFALSDFPGVAGLSSWSEFELTLPVSLRELSRARLRVTIMTWLSPLLSMPLFALLLGQGTSVSELLSSALGIAGWVVLAAVLRQHLWQDAPSPAASVLSRLLVSACVVAGVWQQQPLLGLCALGLGFALEWVLSRRIGSAVELGAVSRGRVLGATSRKAEGLARSLFRQTVWGGSFTGYLLALLLIGGTAFRSRAPALGILFMGPMLVSMIAMGNLQVLRAVDALPIPRRYLLRFMLWPPLLTLLLAVLLGYLWGPQFATERVDVICTSPDKIADCALMVDRNHLRLTRGQPARVAAPSGERHVPLTQPTGFAGLSSYNPYEVAPGSSLDFVSYQLSRLLRDHYASELSPEEVKARYLSSGRPFFHLSSRDLALQRHTTFSGLLFALSSFGIGSLLALLAMISIQRVPATRSERRTNRLGRTAIVLCVAAPLFAQAALPFLNPSSRHLDVLLLNELVRVFLAHPIPLGAVALIVAVALYHDLARRFEQLEAIDQRRFARSDLLEL